MRNSLFNNRIALLGITAILSLACQKEQNCQETAPIQRDFTEVFYATIEEQEPTGENPSTKVYVDENLQVLWNKEDKITIFDHFTYNLKYQFMGEDGDNTGTFQMVPLTEFVTGNLAQYVYAVFPYNSTTTISNDAVISVDLPLAQLYEEKSFGRSANTMISVTEDENLRFRNVGSYLSFRLYGDNVSITGIEFKGNNGEKISGRARIVMTPGGIPETTMTAEAKETVEVFCGSPMTIGADADNATEFLFVIPPTTLTKGFTITVTGSNGETFVKSLSSNIVLERNTIKRMKPLKVEITPSIPIPEAVDLGLSVKWASFNLGATALNDYGEYYSWGETTPEDGYYDWSNYKWGSPSDGFSKYAKGQGKTVLDPEDDAASKNLGGKWRMPTIDEFDELKKYCQWVKETIDGVVCYKVIGPNENYIYIPAYPGYYSNGIRERGVNGYYWSSDIETSDWQKAKNLWLVNGISLNSGKRCFGEVIRPVYGERNVDMADLGLSVKWARYNLGASKPEEYGDYFSWGEIAPKQDYSWETYKWCNGTEQSFTKYCGSTSYGYDGFVDRKQELDRDDDAAYNILGGRWRIPDPWEYEELTEKCSWKYTTLNGINGYKVTGPSGDYIFLPAAGASFFNVGEYGLYWLSYKPSNKDSRAEIMMFDSNKPYYYGAVASREMGLSIRPVWR